MQYHARVPRGNRHFVTAVEPDYSRSHKRGFMAADENKEQAGADVEEKPYVPGDANLPELTVKAIVLGVLMGIGLGFANAYLALRAGMTVSAVFPAAVLTIAAFRLPFFKGSVLEQNISVTTAAVGEALVAGAVFTIPALIISGVWKSFNYWESTLIMLSGGVIGICFIIILRRALVVDAKLPFPEARAAAELIKAGQKGETGAKYVFSAIGLGALVQLLKDSSGIQLVVESVSKFMRFPASVVHHVTQEGNQRVADVTHGGGLLICSPSASPALMGVGFIIGLKYAAISFAGGIFAWYLLVPLVIFANPELAITFQKHSGSDLAFSCWSTIVRPVAVGAMTVGVFWTLWTMRGSLSEAFKRMVSRKSKETASTGTEAKTSRLELDLNIRLTALIAVALDIPLAALYYYFTHSLVAALVLATVLFFVTFFLSAVGGYLVGLIGGSNQPISGLTLPALIITGLLMLALGVKGVAGIGAVLAVTGVVCCASSMAGEMIQDLKVGHILGATPRRMEIALIISVTALSFVLVFAMSLLHQKSGIGSPELPAPQAGLMAQLARGIVMRDLPLVLVLMGMAFAVALILIGSPSPMLVAVGMYLPLETTAAMFVGGLIKHLMDRIGEKRGFTAGQAQAAENRGALIASGFIGGEAIMAVVTALFTVPFQVKSLLQLITRGKTTFGFVQSVGPWLGILVFAGFCYVMVKYSLQAGQAAGGAGKEPPSTAESGSSG
jgi:putative OPT family oligopeptide transporter